MKISIIICTRNRANSLKSTLQSISQVKWAGEDLEIIIVNNGSTDDTIGVIRSAKERNKSICEVDQPIPGLSAARNAGLRHAQGQIIIWTDDDVRVPTDWAVCMTEPIVAGHADVACGGVRMASHLQRAWQTDQHREWLAIFNGPALGSAPAVIGANMAFHRRVIEAGYCFDEELGAGRLGYGEETLFNRQLACSGFKTAFVQNAEVEHHFDPDRLLRKSWLTAAKAYGESNAYIMHHWDHSHVRLPRLQLLKVQAFRAAERLRSGRPPEEGISEREFGLRCYEHLVRGYMKQRGRPRNYERHGLIRVRSTTGSTF